MSDYKLIADMHRAYVRTTGDSRLLSPRHVAWGGICCVSLVGSAAVHAQDTPSVQSEELVEVVVTASRVQREGFAAPTPTTVISAEQVQASGPANLADFVNQLPALAGSVTPRIGTSGAGPTVGSNLFNLRSLGPARTLVLLDGHRVVPSTVTGSVDANLLPSPLVERVDVITGGASAAWGSDAVAGVVNYVLDRTFEGVSTNLQYGISEQGDAESYKAEFAGGFKFADERAHLIVSGEHHEEGRGDRPESRDWFTGRKVVRNPAWTPTNGEVEFLVRDDVGKSDQARGGRIAGPANVTFDVDGDGDLDTVANPLLNQQFNRDGSLSAYDRGTVSGTLAFGANADDVSERMALAVPLRFTNVFSRLSYELTPDVSIYAEASYAQAWSKIVGRVFERNNNVIRIDNPFLPASVRAQMVSMGLTSINVNRMFLDLDGITGRNGRDQQRYVLGSEGTFGDGWSWDIYAQHGETDFSVGAFTNNPVLANAARAIDAVRDPVTGAIVCRSTLTDPGNGCVPLNILGEFNESRAALDYLYAGRAEQKINISQDVGAATLRGDPFDIWAGPVSIAVGAEYRRERYTAMADALSLTDAYMIGNYRPARGSYNVREAFFETVVPLLADVPFVQRFDLNGAVRHTDYSTSGEVTTWKGGATWDINDQVRIRGVASRDIRAPNLNELFAGGTQTNQTIVDPVTGFEGNATVNTFGNEELQPEEADTRSIGIVYRPAWLEGLSLSVDYYDIEIEGAIASLFTQTIIDRCVAGVVEQCAFVHRDPITNIITSVDNLPQNVDIERVRGLDLDASWRVKVGDLGQLTLRAVATRTAERSVTSNGIKVDYAGANANENQFSTAVPRWRTTATATLDSGAFSTTLTSRFISSGVLRNAWTEGVDVDDNHVPSVAYFDLALSYRLDTFGQGMRLNFVVQNLLDEDPPASPNWSNVSTIATGVNGYLYDVIGRQYRLSVSTKF